MLTQDQNDRLTKVGPGTPIGELLRRYWYPISTSQNLQENPVQSIRLLGENFTLFRDRSCNLGLIGQRCLHRNVDLRLGIPEKDGLRCPYHGWLYDSNGNCIEMPAEINKTTFASRVKIDSYAVEELGGLIWGYIGPNPAPLLPKWGIFVRENALRQIGTTVLNCNWLQCQENSVDQVHAEYVHGHLGLYSMERRGISDPAMKDRFESIKRHHLKIGFEEFEYGIIKRRVIEGLDESSPHWKTGHPMVFPNVVLIGRPGLEEFQIRIPIDDTHTWHLVYECYTPGQEVVVPEQTPVPSYEVPVENLPVHVIGQDMIAWEGQGEVTDRSAEKLTEMDRGLIMLRKMIEDQARIVEDGGDPMCTFRNPEENQCIELPMEKYGISHYQKGDIQYNNTGIFSPVWGKFDEYLTAAAEKARATGLEGDQGIFSNRI